MIHMATDRWQHDFSYYMGQADGQNVPKRHSSLKTKSVNNFTKQFVKVFIL
jgi:hypothetical protein